MSARRLLVCASLFLLIANAASAARYQRCRDGKTLVWNSQRGVAQEATWSGLRDVSGYATGQGTLIWYRLNEVVNSYTGKMVQGKFEGAVIKEQAGTRLQAKFADGEKAGGWSEPGSTESTPSPTAKEKPAKATATPTLEPEEPVEEERPSPTPKPTRSPKPTPTVTPRPTLSPTPMPIVSATLTPTPTPRPTPSPTSTPLQTPTPTATRPISTPAQTAMPTSPPPITPALTPPQLKSLPSSPVPQPSEKSLSLGQGLAAPTRDSLDFALPSPSPRKPLPPAPWTEPPLLAPSPKQEDQRPVSVTPGPTLAMQQLTGSKAQMIAEFKKETGSVLAQMKNATQSFREVQGIDTVQTLPAEVSASVSALADQARDFRAKLGYEVTFYECGVETATGEALVAVDQATRELAEKNAPAGRMKVVNFFKRFPTPTRDNQKPLWRYLGSILNSCNRAKKAAEEHLERARSFESAGKREEAIAEYQEIYRIYPNAVTADKIHELQNQPR